MKAFAQIDDCFDYTAAQSGAWIGFPGVPIAHARSRDWDEHGDRHWYMSSDGRWFYRLTSKGFARAIPAHQDELDALMVNTI